MNIYSDTSPSNRYVIYNQFGPLSKRFIAEAHGTRKEALEQYAAWKDMYPPSASLGFVTREYYDYITGKTT